MSVDRRQFLSGVTLPRPVLSSCPRLGRWRRTFVPLPTPRTTKAYGSGYFGNWMEDEFGLPAFRYNCDQINDPKAVTHGKSRTSLLDGTHSSGGQ